MVFFAGRVSFVLDLLAATEAAVAVEELGDPEPRQASRNSR
jgi:hypothetical protein